MNGIGITEYRRYDSSYPLMDGGFSGLFADATFSVFDVEFPVLKSIDINGASLTLNIAFETTIAFTFSINTVLQDNSVQLRDGLRYYGTLVFGPLAGSIAAGNYGSSVNINIPFHPNTFRITNSRAGLYSLQGVHGGVSILTTSDLIINPGSTTTIDAISLPNNLETVTSSLQALYLWDGDTQTLTLSNDPLKQNLIDPARLTGFGSSSFAPNIKMMTTVLDSNNNTILLGATYSAQTSATLLYNCNVYPWKHIGSAPVQLIDITSIGQTLYGLGSNSVVDLGVYPFNTSPVSYPLMSQLNWIDKDTSEARSALISKPGLLKLAGVSAQAGNSFILSGPGPWDPTSSTPPAPPTARISDIFYSAVLSDGKALCSSIGIFNYIDTSSGLPSTNTHLPPTKALAQYMGSNPNTMAVVSGNNVYTVPASTETNASKAAVYHEQQSTLSSNTSILSGGWQILFTVVTPLKSINGVNAFSNSVQLIGDDLISVNKTDTNTITISVSAADELLNLQRKTIYG